MLAPCAPSTCATLPLQAPLRTRRSSTTVDLSLIGGAVFQTTETEKIERMERQSNLTRDNLREEYGRDFIMR